MLVLNFAFELVIWLKHFKYCTFINMVPLWIVLYRVIVKQAFQYYFAEK
jgi:hypothetical protein